jgi:glycine/D-amino acid oxidase-like deaminating enzyme
MMNCSTRSCSNAIWHQLDAELGCDLGLKIKGGFLVAETDEELELGREMATYQHTLGFDVETLGPRELRDLSPNLSPHLKGATYAPGEGSANTLFVAPAFARLAVRGGARVRPYTEVTSIAPRSDGGFSVATSSGQIRACRTLNAAGPWASQLTEMVGVRLSVFGRVIQVNVTRAPRTSADPARGQHRWRVDAQADHLWHVHGRRWVACNC